MKTEITYAMTENMTNSEKTKMFIDYRNNIEELFEKTYDSYIYDFLNDYLEVDRFASDFHDEDENAFEFSESCVFFDYNVFIAKLAFNERDYDIADYCTSSFLITDFFYLKDAESINEFCHRFGADKLEDVFESLCRESYECKEIANAIVDAFMNDELDDFDALQYALDDADNTYEMTCKMIADICDNAEEYASDCYNDIYVKNLVCEEGDTCSRLIYAYECMNHEVIFVDDDESVFEFVDIDNAIWHSEIAEDMLVTA